MMRLRVASEADALVMRGELLRRRTAMRIVAGQAIEPALALAEAAALLHPIAVHADLEALLRRDVGDPFVIRQRLARLERIDVAPELARALHRDCRQHVTLKTDVVALPRRQSDRIDDRRLRIAHMRRARTVTTLASGPRGQLLRKRLRAPEAVAARGHVGIRVVAEHALVPHAAQHAVVIGTVVAGRHTPRANLAV